MREVYKGQNRRVKESFAG